MGSKIQGSKKLTTQQVTWFNPEIDAESLYELVPLTRSVKLVVTELQEAGNAILTAAAEAQGTTTQEVSLSFDEDEKLIGFACEQIDALTKPTVDEQKPLGELIADQWERDLVLASDIIALSSRLVAAAGKRSAS